MLAQPYFYCQQLKLYFKAKNEATALASVKDAVFKKNKPTPLKTKSVCCFELNSLYQASSFVPSAQAVTAQKIKIFILP